MSDGDDHLLALGRWYQCECNEAGKAGTERELIFFISGEFLQSSCLFLLVEVMTHSLKQVQTDATHRTRTRTECELIAVLGKCLIIEDSLCHFVQEQMKKKAGFFI